jgi:tripartite-type tricarboxylate transporter receptor subunit TctC
MRLLTLLFLLALTPPAAAQEAFPNRPVQIIYPYSGGGGIDALGRTLAAGMAPRLGQPVVVLNREGAAGGIGAAIAARSTPDGYTLMFAPALVVSVLPHTAPGGTPYSLENFAPVCQVFENVMTLAVAPNSRFTTLAQVVAEARARPGLLTYGTLGIGSIPHLAAAEFERAAGIQLQHVPFRGDAPMLIELSQGRVDLGPTVLGSIAGKDVRLLTVFHAQRHPAFPNVPTAAEQGWNVAPRSFGGLYAPAGTPAPVLARLEAACTESAAEPAYRDAAARAYQSAAYFAGAAEFGRRLREDVAEKARQVRGLEMGR